MQQQEFADLLGVNLGRAKSLLLGRVKTLTFDETQRLVVEFGVSAIWLNSGGQPRDAPAPAVPSPPGMRAERAVSAGRWAPDERAASVLKASEPAVVDPLKTPLVRGPYAPPIDDRLLVRAIEVVERALAARSVTLEPARRARLIGALYEMSVKTGLVNLDAVEPLLAAALCDPQGE